VATTLRNAIPAATSEQVVELRRQRYNATLIGLRQAHADLWVVRVEPDFRRPPHKPGQYTSLGLGAWEPRHPEAVPEPAAPEDHLIKRAYSISSSILDERGELLDMSANNWLEFYVVLVRGSENERPPALTPRLFMLREKDRLFLEEKITGHFTLDPVKPDDTVVFLSTGTGEAPHNYMLWELLRRRHAGRILCACCVRYRRDLAYLPVHETLMDRYPGYRYLSLTTREADSPRAKVYIQDLITSGRLEAELGRRLDPARTHVYLCGNPRMIGVPVYDRVTGERVYPRPAGAVELLTRRGFRADEPKAHVEGNLHFEEYW
jgi:ferredoxin--NADP+ reductase